MQLDVAKCIVVQLKLCVFLYFSIKTDDHTSTLLVRECTVDDEGDYEVVIENKAGESTHLFETLVNAEAPKINQALPEIVNVEELKPAELLVKFDSPLESTVTWAANGVTLEDSPKYRICTSEEESTLTIANLIRDDTEMTYTCTVKNAIGTADTSTMLSIQCKYPTIG